MNKSGLRILNASYLSACSTLARLRALLLGELGLGGTVIGVAGVMLLPVYDDAR